MFTMKPSNARHHPPRTQRRDGQALRMKATLCAVGCMPLLAGVLHMQELTYFAGDFIQLTSFNVNNCFDAPIIFVQP